MRTLVLAAACAGLVAGTGPEPVAAQTPDLDRIGPYAALGLELSTPEGALAEIADLFAAGDDFRLWYALAPQAQNKFVRLVQYFDLRAMGLPDDPDVMDQVFDVAGIIAWEFTQGGEPEVIDLGAIDLFFFALMGAMRHVDAMPFDLADAAATGAATVIEPNPLNTLLPRVRVEVTGPRLAAPATVFLERSLSGRWRLLGIQTIHDGEELRWLAVPEG